MKKLVPMSYEKALNKTIEELEKVGFGILTEIDVKDTIKQKLDKDFKKYKILGACNPPYAYDVLSENPLAGLILPCNVIVYEEDSDKSVVAILNPVEGIALISENLCGMVSEIKKKLEKVLESI
ncbi:MAG: DUF302 domain-containing protein [Spirochaetota bacterium]